MSLPTPNLDDRTWKQIVEDAKRMIPSLCPHWTDFNPSDPGIALVELMGWMTEMLLYRLNRVPDKNYIKFLETMGITLKPPKSARAWLMFSPSQGADARHMPLIPANTRVSGTGPDEKPITFETLESLNLNSSVLTGLYTQLNEGYSDRTPEITDLETSGDKIDLFDNKSDIPHMFYIGDPALATVGEDFSLRLSVKLEQPGAGLDTVWSCWNGSEWQDVNPALDETNDFINNGDIVFNYLPTMQETDVHGYKTHWLRLRLESYKGGPLPIIKDMLKTLELKKSAGVIPQYGYFSNAEIPFMPMLFQGMFMPFGQEAKENDSMYIGSDVFSRKGIRVALDLVLADAYTPSSEEDLRELKLNWEYFAKNGTWQPLGASTPRGTLNSSWAFIDHTEAFTHSGTVRFYVPSDIAPMEVNGIKQHWIRVAIKSGNYGLKKKKNPPICQRCLIKYKEKSSLLSQYISYDNFNYRYLTPITVENKPIAPFVSVDQDWPEMFIGFDTPFSNKLHSLYFRLERKGDGDSEVIWEYHGPDGWVKINPVLDHTKHFTQNGLVKLIGPADWTVSHQFGKWAFWFRVSWKKHDPKRPPKLQTIQLNTVKAIHAASHKNEVLGSGTAQPFQQFSFDNKPLLPEPRIIVRELESSILKEINDFKAKTREEVVEELDPETRKVKALWVVWTQVDNFYKSERDSRHYILDIFNGTVTFGDGIRGALLPIDQENVRCQVYYTGGGAKGNMGKHTLTNMENAIPFIDSVTNPFPASGGADIETLKDAKLRAPWEIKHRHRAVTLEDFQAFAMDATGEVAYAHCVVDDDGIVQILILPKERPEDKGKLIPSPELLSVVKDHIDKHRLITTSINVYGPKYYDTEVKMVIDLLPEAAHRSDAIRQQIVDAMHLYVHPLKGTMYRKGYRAGQPIYITEIYYIIESIDGVAGIESLTLNGIPVKTKIDMPKDTLAYLSRIDIIFT